MQDTLTRVAVMQENDVLPRIQLAFEGHSGLIRKIDMLAAKEQAEELAENVDTIKSVVAQYGADIRELKNAQ